MGHRTKTFFSLILDGLLMVRSSNGKLCKINSQLNEKTQLHSQDLRYRLPTKPEQDKVLSQITGIGGAI